MVHMYRNVGPVYLLVSVHLAFHLSGPGLHDDNTHRFLDGKTREEKERLLG
jgi:hypothetical protein